MYGEKKQKDVFRNRRIQIIINLHQAHMGKCKVTFRVHVYLAVC